MYSLEKIRYLNIKIRIIAKKRGPTLCERVRGWEDTLHALCCAKMMDQNLLRGMLQCIRCLLQIMLRGMGLKQLKETNELPWGSDCWGGIRSRPAVHQPAHGWGNYFGDEVICADDGDGDDRDDAVLMVTGELCE